VFSLDRCREGSLAGRGGKNSCSCLTWAWDDGDDVCKAGLRAFLVGLIVLQTNQYLPYIKNDAEVLTYLDPAH
jgi:hypothetical protein